MRVLLALDLSPESESLVDRATAWVQRVGGSLQLRSVSALLGEAEAVGSIETSFVAADWDARRRWERQRLNELAERVPEAIRGTTGILDGVPARVIADLSAACDLVILGTHGRTGLRRLFLGSVAESVARSADCPVLILPIDGKDDPDPLPETLTVLAPLDIEDLDLHAAEWVRDRLDPGLRFELTHVLRFAPWISRDLGREAQVTDHPDARRARELLDDLGAAHQLELARTHLTMADTDNPGELLADQARSLGADLIALPTHGRKGLSRLVLGSVASRVIQHAPCPVLVVRQSDTEG